MSRPTLAVVIPNFNHARYLDDCLQSVLQQSRPADHIIVIDDASTDDSLGILKSYANVGCLRLIQNSRNLGTIHSVNNALEFVTQDYTFMLAADDLVLPGHFERCLSLLEANPHADLCCTHPAFLRGPKAKLDLNEDLDRPAYEATYFNCEQTQNMLREKKLWVAGHTSIVKTAACRKAGQYLPQLKWHCDWFQLHVLALRTGVCYIPEALSAMRLVETSYSNTGSQDRRAVAEVVWNMIELLKTPDYEDVCDAFFSCGLFQAWPDFAHEIQLTPRHWQEWNSNSSNLLRQESSTVREIKRMVKKAIYNWAGDRSLGAVLSLHRKIRTIRSHTIKGPK